jgi:hypothetical protein
LSDLTLGDFGDGIRFQSGMENGRSKRRIDSNFGFPLMPEWGQETWHDVDYWCLEEAKRDPRNARLGSAEKLRSGDA